MIYASSIRDVNLACIAYLEKKIQMKDEVLAKLMAEHVAPQKDLGEL